MPGTIGRRGRKPIEACRRTVMTDNMICGHGPLRYGAALPLRGQDGRAVPAGAHGPAAWRILP